MPFISNLLKPSSEIVGLDIGSSSIKVVQLSETPEGLRLEAAGIADNPLAGIKEGEPESGILADSIKDLIHQSNIKTRGMVSALGGSPIVVHYFEFPPLADKELEGAVKLEAEQVISPDMKDMDTDFQVLPPEMSKPDKIAVLFVAVPRKLTEERMKVIHSAGLDPRGIDVDSLALVNCFLNMGDISADLPRSKAGETVIILNVGAKLTNLAIIRKEGLHFVRDIPFGGNDITRAVQKEKEITFDEAEDLKRNPSNWEKEGLDLLDILWKTSTRLIEGIHHSREYYTTRTSVRKMDRILLTGGSSNLPRLDEFISANLDIPVQRWNPLTKVEVDAERFPPRFKEEKGSLLAVALGLATRKDVG